MLAGLLNIVQRGKKKNWPLLNYIFSQKNQPIREKGSTEYKKLCAWYSVLGMFVALNLFSDFDVG